jgi:hypothetical protein
MLQQDIDITMDSNDSSTMQADAGNGTAATTSDAVTATSNDNATASLTDSATTASKQNGTSTTAKDKKPRPSSELGTERSTQIEARLKKDPYDTEAWQMLLTEAQNVGTEEQTRDAFDRFLEQFPTSVNSSLYCYYRLPVTNHRMMVSISYARVDTGPCM